MKSEKVKTAQYNQDGILIHVYNSITEAIKRIGGQHNNIGNIVEASQAKIKYKGYYWKTLKDTQKPPMKIQISKFRRDGKRVQVFRNGKLQFIADTITQAAEQTEMNKDTVRGCLRNPNRISKTGYSFKFNNPEDANRHMSPFIIYKEIINKRSKQADIRHPIKLIHKETKAEYAFSSIGEACKALNLVRQSVTNAISGKIKSTCGYLVQSLKDVPVDKRPPMPIFSETPLNAKSVEIYKDNQLIKIARTTYEAAELTGVSRTRIATLCKEENRDRQSLSGFKFRFHKIGIDQ